MVLTIGYRRRISNECSFLKVELLAPGDYRRYYLSHYHSFAVQRPLLPSVDQTQKILKNNYKAGMNQFH